MADLITSTEYKTYKNINSTNKDHKLTALIPILSTFVKNYCKRTFVDYYGSPNTKTEYFDSNLDTVYPKEFPIETVLDVSTSTDGGVTYTALTENTDYFVDTEEGSITTGDGVTAFKAATTTHKSLRVQYRGGYSAAPGDLKFAMYMLLDYFMDEQYIEQKNVNANFIQNFPPNKLPFHVRELLSQYRELL